LIQITSLRKQPSVAATGGKTPRSGNSAPRFAVAALDRAR
jgi:hypothetical protein